MNKIELQHITKKYSPTHYGAKDINFAVENGECLVLVGPSGAGKSTVLRMIAGLIEPTSGKILIDNQDVTRTKPGERNLTFVFQNLALYPHMTVRENIEFSIKKKLPKDQLKQRVEQVAKDLDIKRHLGKYPKELSGGEEQRTALARSLATDADIILMDEPLSSLDTALKREIIQVIERIKSEKETTMVYITHDHTEAMKLADQILVLHQGEIEQLDDSNIIYNQPATKFVAQFFGQNKMNIFKHHNDYYGVRPENIIIKENGDIPVTITDIEIIWQDVHAKFLYGDQEFTLITRNKRLKVNDEVNVEFTKIHKF